MSTPKDADLEAAREFARTHEPSFRWPEAMLRDLQSTLREAREQGIEQAARAICGPCAEGWEVKCGREDDKPDLWYHPTQEDRGAQICYAGLVRALKEAKGDD